jgi:ribosomal-protein-alanine N-acetyltransferase
MTTDRLLLREPEDSDAPALRDYYRRNAERFAPWEPERPDVEQFYSGWIQFARTEARHNGKPTAFLAFIKDTMQLVAVVTLDGFTSEGLSGATLSFTVDGGYEGRGYASEAVARVIRYAFDELALGALSAHYHPSNARSAKLLERAGFTIVGGTHVVPGFERFMRTGVVAMLHAGGAR